MPLSATETAAAVVKPLPRALSLAGAAVAAATTSLILISVVVSRAHHSASSSTSSPPPSSSASTAAPLPPPPTPSPVPEHLHHPPPPPVPPCPPNATHVIPCHEDDEEASGERHCPPHPPPPPPPHPPKDPPPHPPHPPDHPPPPPPCRVPPPPGYRQPMPWPERRDRAWYANVELPPLTSAKLGGRLDPVRARGDWLVFPNGVGTYVEQLEGMVPLRGGEVRTALDVGCGVASFGDYLLNYGILTMSIDRRNRHKAQVQLALERGLPAMIGVLGVRRLPYPTRSFDMVHCAGCLVPGNSHDELYMLEIDRLLRPGGYWVMSTQPISDDLNHTAKSMRGEQLALEEIAKKLCWSKVSENGTITVWRKPINHIQCTQDAKLLGSPPFCTGNDADSAWYVNTSMCLTRLPRVELAGNIAGGAVEKWPQRLTAVPPRIANGEMKGMPIQTYELDSLDWNKRVDFYRTYLNLSHGSYRNIMDMNAGFGGFAAAMSEFPVWVMNVVPANLTNTLGIIYERGLIGTYMDWCESFSTYPRTYDVIHANGVFSLYMDTCGIPYILLEMDRILRPGGAAIVRDAPDVVHKVKDAADRLHWHSQIVDTENGASDPEKLLIVDNSLPFPDHPA